MLTREKNIVHETTTKLEDGPSKGSLSFDTARRLDEPAPLEALLAQVSRFAREEERVPLEL
ncbi:hypothetical protein PF005_g27824 [Phytophthora fragariae]|uniref:Uncharacterized protein n=1 Tax=Phytophthora fragariae TaxID=53985 RepID=A0A6A3VQ25_9STRA|nr:hypothetical protein PF003_g4713 [Phytophthora fragariae]KAE8962429.1 hypothetical protein PF011_g29397 [Phytophthora fragariae]KAE9164703.1 hypothetical protein PF004_g29740 [Phytophthora fragariae]KAE9168658.1 hypothetical protein PF002_g30561 [Phytophthora fragariae]KAE9169772.1 hypothetical protein PF005_g27824 [Phytophthora fragariae]